MGHLRPTRSKRHVPVCPLCLETVTKIKLSSQRQSRWTHASQQMILCDVAGGPSTVTPAWRLRREGPLRLGLASYGCFARSRRLLSSASSRSSASAINSFKPASVRGSLANRSIQSYDPMPEPRFFVFQFHVNPTLLGALIDVRETEKSYLARPVVERALPVGSMSAGCDLAVAAAHVRCTSDSDSAALSYGEDCRFPCARFRRPPLCCRSFQQPHPDFRESWQHLSPVGSVVPVA